MLRVSPQKLNLVAQLIRGRKASAGTAEPPVSRSDRVDVKKCLESAIANAETITTRSTILVVAGGADAFRPRIQLRDKIELLRLTRSIPGHPLASLSARPRSRFVLLNRHSSSLLGFLVAEWPWKVRVGENSPNLWPTISR